MPGLDYEMQVFERAGDGSVMTSQLISEPEQTLKNWSFRLISRLEDCVS